MKMAKMYWVADRASASTLDVPTRANIQAMKKRMEEMKAARRWYLTSFLTSSCFFGVTPEQRRKEATAYVSQLMRKVRTNGATKPR